MSQPTKLPEGPHGVAPNDSLPHGVVAQEDKSYTTRIAEAAQPVVTPVVNAAQPILQAAADALSSVTAAGQAAVASGATALGLTGDKSTGPHGVPPSDTLPHGVVAQQDKSYSTRIAETAQPVVTPVVNAAQPVIAAAQPVIAAAANVANNVVQTGADTISSGVKAVGLGPHDPNARPEGPHGVAPNDNLPHGVVAQEDKSLTTKVAEAAQPVTQPVVNAAAAASDIANKASAAVGAQAANLGAAAVDLKDSTLDAAHSLQVKAGLPVHVNPGEKPVAPHGVPPTNYNHGGIVSDQDKSLPQKIGEKLADVKDQTVAQVNAAAGQVGYQAGLTGHPVVAGEKPEAPHGVPPTNYNHEGLVAEQDKTVAQKVGEKVADVRAQTGL